MSKVGSIPAVPDSSSAPSGQPFPPIGASTSQRTTRGTAIAIALPVLCVVAIVATYLAAPADAPGAPQEHYLIFWATIVALVAGLSSTAIGVYGGVLVPGLLVLRGPGAIDPAFIAAMSVFVQVVVIPIGAGTHYRLGNFSRKLAMPLIVGGMIGSFIGPLVGGYVLSNKVLGKPDLAHIVAVVIIAVGVLVLATLRLGNLGTVRDENDVPAVRVGGIGLVAGFATGISGAGWGPIGVKMLILSRFDPRKAIGSSLVARVFMASAAVVAYVIAATAFKGIQPDWWLVIPILAGSVAPMIPGALVVTRIGREKATVAITFLSIGLAAWSLTQ